jgi:hypothetical protein
MRKRILRIRAAQQEEEIAGTNEDEHDGNQVVGDLEDSA